MRLRLTLLAAAAAAALAAAPMAAGFTGAAPEPQHKGPVAAEPGTCTPAHLAAIAQGFADAREMTAAAIRFLEEQPDHPHVARYFGTTPRKVLAEHYRLIGEGIEGREALQLRCEDARFCGTGGTFAYVLQPHAARPQAVMGFCRAYFAAARTGQDNRGGIVIHEVSHLAINARDAQYQPNGARDLAKDEPHVAAMNADNYEYFAEFLPR
ncbi:MAG TPA: M35 family metallo-endopeptidase [Acetobacteraceae bacterium]|nr:M35 family metallo-endopeptidase [Acetobacteraceae bacterium]